MGQSISWEVNSESASQEMIHFLWNPKVQYRVHNSPALDIILNQMNPGHIFSPYFPKIQFNIILQSTPRSLAWSLPFRFSDQNVVRISYYRAS
jgi:hypothetical protein